jgi:diaminopimelate epimerase
MEFNFFKYQGTGNDFIIIDDRHNIFPFKSVKFIKKLCDRKFGIGADGLMLIRNSKNANFKMLYANADGKSSTMCGNGGRCIVQLAHHLKICTANSIFFEATDGMHHASVKSDIVTLQMKNVSKIEKLNSTSFIIDTGSPHFVMLHSKPLQDDKFVKAAQKIRYNATFNLKGINVNFLNKKSNSEIAIRTYERGVENETLSCGTGAVACALVIFNQQNIESGKMKVSTMGGALEVTAIKKPNGSFENINLIGPAVCVYQGQIMV